RGRGWRRGGPGGFDRGNRRRGGGGRRVGSKRRVGRDGLDRGLGGRRRRGQVGERRLVQRHRLGELLDDDAKLAQLGGERRLCRRGGAAAVLERGKAAAEFRHLAGEVGGSAGEVGDLVANVGAVAQPRGHRVVEREAGQGGKGDDRGFGSVEAEQQVEHGPTRGRDQHHANG